MPRMNGAELADVKGVPIFASLLQALRSDERMNGKEVKNFKKRCFLL